MCGRFVHQNDPKTVQEFLNSFLDKDFNDLFEVQSWNIAPRQQLLAVANQEPPGLNKFMFGFIPSFNEKATWFNTRDDTLFSGKGYWQRFRQQRCIILANGFYEWQGEKPPKQPLYIQVKGEETIAFAGLWHVYKDRSKNQEVRMATIITTQPNKFMVPIHNRMPVILTKSKAKKWLSDAEMNLEEMRKLMKPFPASKMTAYPVSTQVNSYANDGPELIRKLK